MTEGGYTASYKASASGGRLGQCCSASGEAITVTAKMAGRGQDHRHRDGENGGRPRSMPDADRLERRLTHVPRDGGRRARWSVTLSAEPMEIEAGGTTMITATANRAVDGW